MKWPPWARGALFVLMSCQATHAPRMPSSSDPPFLPTAYAGKAHADAFKKVTVGPSDSLTLVDYSGAGLLTKVWLNSSGDDADVVSNSTIAVYVDGEKKPSVLGNIDNLFFHYFNDKSFFCHDVGLVLPSAAGSAGGYVNLRAPFRSHLKVVYQNGSASNPAHIYAQVFYQTGATYDWGRYGKLHGIQFNSDPDPYSEQTIADVDGQGALYGIHFNFAGGLMSGGFNALEGRFRLYTDGERNASYITSGTEDFFFNGAYFGADRVCTEEFGTPMRDSLNHRVGAYRYFKTDPPIFDTEIRLTWEAGIKDIGHPVSVAPHIQGMVFYYTVE
jgi:Protein of unknown function (DUF2961)